MCMQVCFHHESSIILCTYRYMCNVVLLIGSKEHMQYKAFYFKLRNDSLLKTALSFDVFFCNSVFFMEL